MKITDSYTAKYKLWAAKPRIMPAPVPARIPNFKSRRFSSHEEMNAWKNSLIHQLALSSVEKWTK